jgi:hypothetical protein
MAFASPSDVEARLGRSLTDAEIGQAAAYLDDVEAEIISRLGDITGRATDPVFLSLLVRVEASAAKRVFLNPGGIRQHSESVDDYSQSDTYDTSISTGGLYVSDDEWMLLGGGSSGSGSFSMLMGYS